MLHRFRSKTRVAATKRYRALLQAPPLSHGCRHMLMRGRAHTCSAREYAIRRAAATATRTEVLGSHQISCRTCTCISSIGSCGRGFTDTQNQPAEGQRASRACSRQAGASSMLTQLSTSTSNSSFMMALVCPTSSSESRMQPQDGKTAAKQQQKAANSRCHAFQGRQGGGGASQTASDPAADLTRNQPLKDTQRQPDLTPVLDEDAQHMGGHTACHHRQHEGHIVDHAC